MNLTAGRSVVCVDRKGDGKYGFYVANYGGPTRFYELNNDLIRDIAPDLKIDKITGGRAVVAGHILSNKMDIFAANERGPNFLYLNEKDQFYNVSTEYNTDDVLQNGRGTTLTDFLYRGNLDIINGNWEGFHRIFVNNETTFNDMASKEFRIPSRIRTIISADFDNDGYDEIFMNNIGEPNKLFKILENGKIIQIKISNALEKNGSENIKNCSGNLRTALVLGSENLGLRRLTREKISVSAKIPIAVQTESLNVSNAAAIALYVIQKD